MLPEFFCFGCTFLFLLFDKFLSVKFFLVNFFYLTKFVSWIFSYPPNFHLKNYLSHKKIFEFFFSENDNFFSKNRKKSLSENRPYGRAPYGWPWTSHARVFLNISKTWSTSLFNNIIMAQCQDLIFNLISTAVWFMFLYNIVSKSYGSRLSKTDMQCFLK